MTEPSIDPDAAEALRTGSPAPVRLLLTCAADVEPVVVQLGTTRMAVVDRIADLGILVVEATEDDLGVLATLDGVLSVELDGEERAL